uniref:Condensin complex subunit 1 n=1 Tax=Phallusia mammillata TaxID=59560 RepID=A0A6F9DM62_9ASCI|nr:condensin complex subunit 1 [Phallusia mammillata]
MNFVIPENREDLQKCASGQYYVEALISSRHVPIKLQEAKTTLLRSDGTTIDQYFDVFFTIISKFPEIDSTTKVLAWTILKKGCETFSGVLGKYLSDILANDASNSTDKKVQLCALKMYVYLVVEMMRSFQNQSTQHSGMMASPPKGRKQTKPKSIANLGMDWEKECQHGLQLMMNFVDLDIHRLWDSQIVEDEVPSLINNLCYKLMEDPTLMKAKPLKSVLFHLLGCITKKHNQSLSAALKLLQLLQHFEHVAVPLSEAVQLWVESFKCKTLVSEIMREVSNIPEREFTRDTTSTKTMCTFILELARLLPTEFLSNISLLLQRMDEESYTMRNTVLGVMGEILVRCLNGEGLEKKAKAARDQFFDILYDHANLDTNAFVRSKAIHIFVNLVKEQSLPVKRYPDVVELGVNLLLDKSNLVRKTTVQLLETLLRCNPFAATLPISVLQQQHKEAIEQLLALQATAPTASQTEQEKESNDQQEPSTVDQDLENSMDATEEIEINSEEKIPEMQHESEEVEKQKSVVTYYEESIQFVEKLQEAVPVLCQLLHSRTNTDVLEAINFFTAAWEFKMNFALQGIGEMLNQIWNEDSRIREAVVYAYKELYFKQKTSSSVSHPAQVTDNMIMLVASSSGSKLGAVQALIGEMQKADDISRRILPILWERLADPPTFLTMEKGISELQQQKVITQLLAMLSHDNPSIIRSKLDTLVEVGLNEATTIEGSREVFDYELPYNTCVALSNLGTRKQEAGKYEKPFRLPDDHAAIVKISSLLTAGFEKESKSWIRFAIQAVGSIFQLASHPVTIITSVLKHIKATMRKHMSSAESTSLMKQELLTRFFHICGQSALKLLIFVDGDVQAELKQRRKLQEEKEEKEKQEKRSKKQEKTPDKNESNLEEDMGVGGATVDDADQEFIKNILETEIVGPGSLLGGATELIVRTSLLTVEPGDITGIKMQQSATLALAKYMLVSCDFCERHLRIFFTILDTSPHEGVRANLIVAAGDLCVRFPNLLEPWTSKIYARLQDHSDMVRIYGIKVITSLILNDMIKVKGYVSEMARCIVDINERISMLARRFFQELAKKGNSVYNVMPDIISRLSDRENSHVDSVDFKSIMRFLFDYIQKDRQTESLVEKLCHRFKTTRELEHWRDLAFCLTLLNYSERGSKRIIENYSFYAETLRDETVYFAFNTVLSKCKKSAKDDLKNQLEELEGKIIDAHAQGVSEDESAAKAAQASKQYKIVPQSPSVSQTPSVRRTAKKKKSRKPRVVADVSDDDVDVKKSPRPTRRITRKQTALQFSSDDDDFSDDVKENIGDTLLDSTENVSTPIRRVKTPKRTPQRSVIRV